MAEIVLFHHVLGSTAGMQAVAKRFRSAGHTVHLALDDYELRTAPAV